MSKDQGVYVVDILLKSGKNIKFRTDEWDEYTIIGRLERDGVAVDIINRTLVGDVQHVEDIPQLVD